MWKLLVLDVLLLLDFSSAVHNPVIGNEIPLTKNHLIHQQTSVKKGNPPPYYKYAKMARYVVHVSDWGSLATISTHTPIQGFPFANIYSLSDGLKRNSTGIPYLYTTNLEISVHDLMVDDRASLSMTLAQTDYCRQKGWDMQDPVCAHISLTGHFIKLKKGSEEYQFGEKVLFARHPRMAVWPKGHNFFVAKLNVTDVRVIDFFGGFHDIAVTDYFNATP